MATHRQRDGIIEVTYVTNIVDSSNKVIKRNVKGKSVVHIDDIRIVDFHYTNAGILDAKKCRIYHSDIGWMILLEQYQEIADLKSKGQLVVKGFKTKKELTQFKKLNKLK